MNTDGVSTNGLLKRNPINQHWFWVRHHKLKVLDAPNLVISDQDELPKRISAWINGVIERV